MNHPKGLNKNVFIFDSGYRGECPREDIEQINSVSWFRNKYPELIHLCFHPVNESKVSAHYRGKLSKMGLQSGIADWVILSPSNGYHYACIELKRANRRKSTVSKTQKLHLNAVAECGGFAAVAYGFNEFKKAVEFYFNSGKVDGN